MFALLTVKLHFCIPKYQNCNRTNYENETLDSLKRQEALCSAPSSGNSTGRTGLRQLHTDLSPNSTHEQGVSENLVPTNLETAELTQSEHGNHTKYPKFTGQLTRLENAENPNYYIAVWGRITLDKYLTPKTKKLPNG